jgi:hypothetical protein
MTKTSTFGLILLALAGCAKSYVDLVDDKFLGPLSGTGGAMGAASSSSGSLVCTPAATQPCYDGPAATLGVGLCKGGTQTCAADGMSWGACVGEVLPQAETCASALDQNCDGITGCTGVLAWARGFGQPGDQYGTSVASDSAGNALVAGYFSGTLDLGGASLVNAGPPDVFLAKLDPSGAPLWAKQFGDTGDQRATGVAVDGAGNVAAVGTFSGTLDFGGGALTSAGASDVFVAKLDPSGAHLWSKRFGDAGFSQYGTAVAVDGAGNVVVSGYFFGTVDFGGGALTSAGSDDLFVAKLDPSGNHLWSKSFGGLGSQYARSVAVDKAGNVILAGGFALSVDFGGGALASVGGQDIFVAKLDPSGNHVWSKRYGDAQDQVARGVAVDGAGNVVVTGDFKGAVNFGGNTLTSAGSSDVFIVKLGANGAHTWSKGFGDAQDQIGQSVAVDKDGNALVTGSLAGAADFGGGALTSGGNGDIFVVKLDASGAHQWSKRFGDAAPQVGQGIAADAAGNALVTGYFNGTVDFGAGPLTSAGGADIFLAKFGP